LCGYFEALGAVDGSKRPQDACNTQNLDDVDGVATANDKYASDNRAFFVHNISDTANLLHVKILLFNQKYAPIKALN